MKYTTNLKLDLYEADDLALLTDGYNHAMELIDAWVLRNNTDVNTVQQAIALLSDQISKLDARVTALEQKS